MILDIILIVLFVLMMIYGYVKGCIGIVARLVSLVVAFILAYLLAETVGNYISITTLGESIRVSIESNILEKLITSENSSIVFFVQEKLGLENEQAVVEKIIQYVFIGIGFVSVFVVTRLVLWIAQKILENIFELPVLKMFNKLGGVIASAVLFVIEVSIILAIIKSVSALAFMNTVINFIQSSVIIKALYDHNIVTNLILSKII